MDPKKKNILASLITAGIVAYWMYNQFPIIDMADPIQVGQFLLKTIGVSVITHIVMVIVLSLLVGIFTGKQDNSVFDERDQLIELYVMRVILVIFSIGFVTTLVLVGWNNLSINMSLVVLFLCMYAANIIGDLLKLYWYR
ncbi:MAG TPA: hypothetical protein DC023_01200 [Oceanospirillaceae bacterium]|nr:hypothetical protein [Oceanospirillaceae bacterium]